MGRRASLATETKKFFIVGAQKAGTTALHSFLSRHPDITMSSPKELHFFDDERMNWSAPLYDRLEKHFAGCATLVVGEATPIYSYWLNSMERIKAYDPGAKIIMLLRHPAFRAFSHWKMETVRRAETLSFAAAMSEEGRLRVSQAGVHRVFSYVERGFYAPQIRRLLSLFPRAQIHFATADDLWSHPGSTLADVEDFLGVPRRLEPTQEYIILASTETPSELDAYARRKLDVLYADDIRETMRLTGLDLSAWLSSDYAEATKAP